MSLARRVWKWTAATLAVIVVLLALLVAGLRLWLESSPTVAEQVVQRVEAASGLRLRFDRLQARLGWYGPELVFTNARILAKRSDATLVTARDGRVGFDAWRAISSGRLASLRVQLDGAVVHLLLKSSGVELLGQEALTRGEADSTPLRVADLPVGRVRLDDGMVVVEDQRQVGHGFRIEHVRLDLDRRPSALTFAMLVRLPPQLGTRLDLKGSADGTGEPGTLLRWTATADGRALNFAGMSDLVKDVVRLPTAGRGNVRVTLTGADRAMTRAEASFDLKDLVLPAKGADRQSPTTLAGALTLDRSEQAASVPGGPREGALWRLAVRNLDVATGAERVRRGAAEAEWLVEDGAVRRFKLKVPDLPLSALAPFTALAGSDAVREAGAALAPRGRLSGVDLTATRVRPGGRWAVDGQASFRGLGIGAWRNVPGFSGVDGDFVAHGTNGTVALRAAPLGLDLAQYLRAPVTATEVGALVRWSQQDDGWHLESDDAHVATPDAHGSGLVRLWIPAAPEPPHLVLDLNVADAELRGAVKYLPLLRFPADAVAWLDAAFLAGHLTNGRVQYVGPTEGFPFRDHQGLWFVTGSFSGAQVHYSQGWADLEEASGDVEFRNQGFRAHLKSGRMGGLSVSAGETQMIDFRDADLMVRGAATGDLHRALQFAQNSPVGKSLGSYFASLDGHGGFNGNVSLLLPLRHFGDRRIALEAHLERATAHLPGLAEDVTDINGSFRLDNLDLSVPELRATVLGGPVTLRGNTASPARDAPGVHLTTLKLDGRATGERLMQQLDITEGSWLGGGTDWHADVRLPRLDWMKVLPPKPPEPDLGALRALQAGRPLPPAPHDDRPPLPRREPESRWLPMEVRLDAPLSGLAIGFPAPLQKPADETRRLSVTLRIDPGVRPDDEVPPRSLANASGAHAPRLDAQASLGSDQFLGEWRAENSSSDEGPSTSAPAKLALVRGAVRLGGGAPRLHDEAGVFIDGHVARFDLSAWLSVKTSDKPGSPLSSWLKGGDVSVDSFGVLGFNLHNLHGDFAAGPDAWLAHGNGATAAGTVRVPYDLKGAQPLVLELDRLVLNEHDADGDGQAKRDPPSVLPAMEARIGSFEFMKRRLGNVTAKLVRIEGGVRLERGEIRAPSFSVEATGRWTGEGDNEWCEIDGTAHSTDVKETLLALAFEPSMSAPSADAKGELRWRYGLDATILERLYGHAHVQARDGQILTVQPGAGRVLGLLSVATLPRRLALDFHDLTEKGFAFDSLQGDFEFRDGNAYTNNVVVKGPAADIGLIGRTGFKAQDYDQTAVVTGHFSDGLAAAGAIAGGPVIGGALFLFGKVFQGAVEGIARGYYRISGTWDKPRVDNISSTAAHQAEAGSGALHLPPNLAPSLPPGVPPEAPDGAAGEPAGVPKDPSPPAEAPVP